MIAPVLATLSASIPSPSFSVWKLGPLEIHIYGLCIALGVIAAVTISSKRWEKRGGNPDDISTIALFAVPAGVVGARLYHVSTDWKTYEHNLSGALKITQGGLGIPGGILAGVLAGILVARRKHLPTLDLLDVVAPAIPVAQAIGRFGNYFNQEVFGRPTSLPWGLEIDPERRPARFLDSPTFHPTFLYEGLWNLALAGLLLWLDKKKKLHRGELFTLYVLGYAVGRFWVEGLRSDAASLIFGVRINTWISLLVAVATLAVLVRNRRRYPDGPPEHHSSVAAAGDGVLPDEIDTRATTGDAVVRPADATDAGREPAGGDPAASTPAGRDPVADDPVADDPVADDAATNALDDEEEVPGSSG